MLARRIVRSSSLPPYCNAHSFQSIKGLWKRQHEVRGLPARTYLTGQDLRSTSETAREKFDGDIIPFPGWLRILRDGSNFRHGSEMRMAEMQMEGGALSFVFISADSRLAKLIRDVSLCIITTHHWTQDTLGGVNRISVSVPISPLLYSILIINLALLTKTYRQTRNKPLHGHWPASARKSAWHGFGRML